MEHKIPTEDEAPRNLTDPKNVKFGMLDKAYTILILATTLLPALIYGIFLSLYRLLKRNTFQKPVSVRNRVCFVTGSGRGLGREICLALARKGAILACADVNDVTNSETLRLLKEMGAKAKSYKLNVANKQEVERAARQVEEELGPVYLVLNNAAIVMPPKEPTEEFVRASFNVNVLGYYWVMEAFLPYLKRRNDGHIVNICSVGSLCPDVDLNVYCATKAAIRSLTTTLYMDLRMKKSNVKVSMVNPFLINTAKEYEDSIELKAGLKMLSMTSVVDTVMKIVKYGIFEISVPSSLQAGLILYQFLPPECTLLQRSIILKKANHIENDKYENYPHANLVRLCSNAESMKQTKIL